MIAIALLAEETDLLHARRLIETRVPNAELQSKRVATDYTNGVASEADVRRELDAETAETVLSECSPESWSSTEVRDCAAALQRYVYGGDVDLADAQDHKQYLREETDIDSVYVTIDELQITDAEVTVDDANPTSEKMKKFILDALY